MKNIIDFTCCEIKSLSVFDIEIFSEMADKTVHDKTIEYLINLRNESSIEESDYRQILVILCDRILHQEVEKINSQIEKKLESKQKCNSCGEILESWEKEICGPCKIKDSRFEDELDE